MQRKLVLTAVCAALTVAFLAAGKLDGLSAAVGYYGGQTARNADLKPKAPPLIMVGPE